MKSREVEGPAKTWSRTGLSEKGDRNTGASKRSKPNKFIAPFRKRNKEKKDNQARQGN